MPTIAGQRLWNRRSVTIAGGTSGPIPHGLTQLDKNIAPPIDQAVQAIPQGPQLVGTWDGVTSVTNNGDGTFTFLGTDTTLNVLFVLYHTIPGPGLVPIQ